MVLKESFFYHIITVKNRFFSIHLDDLENSYYQAGDSVTSDMNSNESDPAKEASGERIGKNVFEIILHVFLQDFILRGV